VSGFLFADSESDASLAERERQFRERLEAAPGPSNSESAMETEEDEDGSSSSSKRRKGPCQHREKELSNTPVTTATSRYSDDEADDADEELSPEEAKLLQEENAQMFSKFQTAKDSVKLIEHKVVRIAELQEMFTEKVLQQKEDIDLLSATAVSSTENVKDGNEELRKAIQNQASIRVYILFFLLMMSFSLLFLDWYND
jgi:syntaxin 18